MRVATCASALLGVVCLAAYGQGQQKEKTPPDQEKMQGKWKVVRYEFTGKAGKAEYGEPDTISGDKWLRPKRRTDEYQLKIGPTREPKWVDLSAKRLGEKPLMGIYKFEGDQLFICYSYDPDLPRPTE